MLQRLRDYAAPLTAFAISIAFWPGLAGAATSPRWAIAALSLCKLDWRCLPFVAVCFTVLDFDAAVHWTILCAAFSWGLNGHSRTYASSEHFHVEASGSGFKVVIAAFCAGIAASSCVAIAQSLGWNGIYQIAAPAGLFLNKNILAEAACLGFIAALSARLWPAALVCLPTLILTASRSAILAALVGMLFLSPRSWRLTLSLSAVAVLFGLVFLGYAGTSYTLFQRFGFWSDAIPHIGIWGNGSYQYLGATFREPHLHNDWLQLVYELGIFGIVPLAVVLVAGTKAAPFVAALIVIVSFGFPLQMPATGWFAAFVIGHHLRGLSDDRRVSLRARMA